MYWCPGRSTPAVEHRSKHTPMVLGGCRQSLCSTTPQCRSLLPSLLSCRLLSRTPTGTPHHISLAAPLCRVRDSPREEGGTEGRSQTPTGESSTNNARDFGTPTHVLVRRYVGVAHAIPHRHGGILRIGGERGISVVHSQERHIRKGRRSIHASQRQPALLSRPSGVLEGPDAAHEGPRAEQRYCIRGLECP